MTTEKPENDRPEGLPDEELEQEDAELLEDREVMTILPIPGDQVRVPLPPVE
jgi:hypothetical protein